jgi:formylglycine-generating enzyme
MQKRSTTLAIAAVIAGWSLFILQFAALAQDPAAAPTESVQDCLECPELVPMPDGSMMGRYPITRDEFGAFAAETGFTNAGCLKGQGIKWQNDPEAGWDRPGFDQDGDHPVVCVSWNEATAYADWLSERTGKSYRLPTQEELTAAAAAGGTGTYVWGDDLAEICRYANVADATFIAAIPDAGVPPFQCEDGYAYTAPVYAFPPNALGIYDASGNVWQWTNSCLRGDCANAVMRGGGWNVANEKFFRTSESWGGRVVLRNFVIGFRVMRDPE